jgi:1,4-alpha-glucan branching enzyme
VRVYAPGSDAVAVLARADGQVLAPLHPVGAGGLWEKLGAHVCSIDGVPGVAFAVWAPNARQVGLAGDFNWWNSRCHPMRRRAECGVWEIFLPQLAPGALYKFDVLGADGLWQLKSDPYAFSCEMHPGHAGRVTALPEPVADRASVHAEAVPSHGQPMSLSLNLPPLAVLWLEPEGAA